MNSRLLIVTILGKFDRNPCNLERLVERSLVESDQDRRDRRFIFENVYGIVRNRTRLDFIIKSFLDDARLMQNMDVMPVLRLGVYQLVFLDKVPDHAAVNESVDLVKNNPATARFAGVVNAVLRACIKQRGRLPVPDPALDLAQKLSIQYSHPLWLVERWLGRLGLGSTKKLLEFNNTPPDNFLRRKLRGFAKTAFENDIKSIAEPCPGYLGLYYKLQKRVDIALIGVLRSGCATIQAPSSGWVTALLDVGAKDRCVDLCSAPGGKATLIAELCEKGGSVCAAELKFSRMDLVVENMQRMGLRNMYPLVCNATATPFTGVFDKVLLDAPCSGTGVMHRHPDARWIRTPETIEAMLGVQARLLDAAAGLTAVGGVLVYSTCSIEKEENEAQIERFLAANMHFRLEKAPQVIPQSYVTLEGYLKISPWEHGLDGMFGARLKRIA